MAKKSTEVEQEKPGRSSNVVAWLLVGALIAFGGLIVGGAAGYALGRMQANLEENDRRAAVLGVGVLYIEEGALVHAVLPGGPAEDAGLMAGDIITHLDGHRISEESPLEPLIAEHRPGDVVEVRFTRGGEPHTLDVELGEVSDLVRPFPAPRRIVPPIAPVEPLEPEPFIGIVAGREQGRGVLIDRVLPGSPAEEAGLLAGDVILRVDDERVDTLGQLREMVSEAGVGGTLELEIERGTEQMLIEVVVGSEFTPALPRLEGDAPYLGVVADLFTEDTARELDLSYPGSDGVLIVGVEPDSPARHVGLQENDVILSVDNESTEDLDTFRQAILSHRPGDVVHLLVFREGEPDFVDFEVALGARRDFPAIPDTELGAVGQPSS